MALTDKLTAIANAIRSKTGGTATMTLDEMPSEIASISSGGTEITNGVIWNAVGADGYPTEATFYGTVVPKGFGANYFGGWSKNLQTINFHDDVRSIGECAFGGFSSADGAGLTQITIPNSVTSLGNEIFKKCNKLVDVIYNASISPTYYMFADCTELKTFIAPYCTEYTASIFASCPKLETVQLGSVGNAVVDTRNIMFAYNSSKSTGTVTVYTTESYKDTALTNIRNGLPNATIIVKDSTTGDTIVTSTP